MKRKTQEEFENQVYNLVGNEYTVLGEYITNKKKILFKHNTCNHEFEMRPNNFLDSGDRCPKCSGHAKKSLDEFKNEVYNLVGDEYTVLSSEYSNNKTKILIRHNKCNYEWKTSPNAFLSNKRNCPNCNSNNTLLSTEEFKNRVYNLVGNEYTVLGDYKNTSTKILMKHNKCNHEYEVRPRDFTKNGGNRCPICSKSKGEDKISNFLNKYNIRYEREKRFENCRYKKTLPFDFYLPDNNTIIEFDGIQHFEQGDFGPNTASLDIVRLRDSIKNEFCINNGIQLIRIPYFKENKIETILKRELRL